MKYWISMAGLTGLDLLIKRIIENRMQTDSKKYVLRDKLIIRKHHNDGAVFDSFPAKKTVIYAASYALFGFFAGLFATEKSNVKKIGLMFILELLVGHKCRFTLCTGDDKLTRFTILF